MYTLSGSRVRQRSMARQRERDIDENYSIGHRWGSGFSCCLKRYRNLKNKNATGYASGPLSVCLLQTRFTCKRRDVQLRRTTTKVLRRGLFDNLHRPLLRVPLNILSFSLFLFLSLVHSNVFHIPETFHLSPTSIRH